jgi:hypothetical protein
MLHLVESRVGAWPSQCCIAVKVPVELLLRKRYPPNAVARFDARDGTPSLS